MHCKSYSHFFSKKFQHICISHDVNFKESLTNDVISFEQLGPGYVCTTSVMRNQKTQNCLVEKKKKEEAMKKHLIKRLFLETCKTEYHQTLCQLVRVLIVHISLERKYPVNGISRKYRSSPKCVFSVVLSPPL